MVFKDYEEAEIVMKDARRIAFYVLEGSSMHALATMPVISKIDRTKLWHLRLRQMNVKKMLELSKQGLLCSDKIYKLEYCEDCIFGKAHKSKFSKGFHKFKQVLHYVYADVLRPAQVLSFSGGRYLMSMIDNYTKNVWIYILKTKDQALEKFKVSKALVET